MLLYSGDEEENTAHTEGVALMLSGEARKRLIGWGSLGSRINKASLKTKREGITMKTAISNSRTITEKVKVQTEYTEANEQVDWSIRADKKK
ncbi:unnamed protein product [Schistosoma curassoni]|uniref:Uncharacterized protein n=1 Tax=Schistosoma curassoni TaxID=6186 RepID=A0A183JSK6_9TREM|nr:unnamed protein product [Schistosoma curassoni]